MKSNSTLRLAFFILSLFIGHSLIAQTPGSAYIAQDNDWLSKIAETAYGNPHLYHLIIDGTNEKALTDNSFDKVVSPNRISTGQKFWIPGQGSGAAKENSEDGQLVAVPKTNCEIRIWYNYQVVAISVLNNKWIAWSKQTKVFVFVTGKYGGCYSHPRFGAYWPGVA